jgi:PAS domain S-box-containing protein
MSHTHTDGYDEFGDLIASIHHSPIATIVTDNRLPDNPIVDVNAAFSLLTGYERDAIVGQNCRFLAGPATEAEARAAVREAIACGEPVVAELLNYRKDGTPFRNALMIAPVRDASGKVALFLGSQMDADSGHGATGLRAARAKAAVSRLTPRLRQVLELMLAGYRNKQIGGALGIGEKTVKMHRARLKEALGVETSAEVIRIGLEAALTASDPDSRRSGQ